MRVRRCFGACRGAQFVFVGLLIALATPPAFADIMPLDTDESAQYLIIATDRINGNTDVATSNFELGANKAPVPCTDNFLDDGGSGGPTLEGAVPDLPSNAAPLFQGVDYDGNIAVTDSAGEFELQNVGVYGSVDVGIRVAGPMGSDTNKSGDSFFNDPNMFPNTFDVGTQEGETVDPSQADQATRIDSPNHAGVTYNVDHTALIDELAAARSDINSLAPTSTLDLSGNGGKIDSDFTLTLVAGLNVIDIITGDNDFVVQDANFVIDGPATAAVVLRLPGSDNMKIANANVLMGNGGIQPGSILVYTDQDENDTHFDFSNALINGVAFWSLGDNGGEITVSNAQGCTQLVADVVDLDDVRFGGCSFGSAEAIPEPATIALIGIGALAMLRRRRQS